MTARQRRHVTVAPGLYDPPGAGVVDVAALAWQGHAVCAEIDPELWFPEKGGATRTAKKVCGACPVRQECLEYALDTNQLFGVWGGLSADERQKFLRANRKERAA